MTSELGHVFPFSLDQEGIVQPASISLGRRNSGGDKTASNGGPLKKKVKKASQEAFSPTNEADEIKDSEEERKARWRKNDWINRERWKVENKRLKEENERLKTQNKWLQREVSSFNKNQPLIHQIEVIENQKIHLCLRIDSLKNQIKELKEKNINLREEVDQWNLLAISVENSSIGFL